jgi:transcriptional regulator with XRE-family HTH domain
MTTRIGYDRRGTADAEEALLALQGGRALTFGEHLRAIRLGEEMTQAEMAKKLGVTKAHVSDLENGRKVVSIDRAACWAKTLGYHPADFVRLAINDAIRRAGLRYSVDLKGQSRAG